jgi:hypothetical protein
MCKIYTYAKLNPGCPFVFSLPSSCIGARIHPPSFYVAITMCNTKDQMKSDAFNDADKRKAAQENGVEDLLDGNGWLLTIETSMYLLSGNPMDGIGKMIKGPLDFLKNAGGAALGGAVFAGANSVNKGNSKKSILGKAILGAVQATFPFAVSSSIMNPPPAGGPVENLANNMMGAAAILFAIGMFAKEIIAAGVGQVFENPADFLMGAFEAPPRYETINEGEKETRRKKQREA